MPVSSMYVYIYACLHTGVMFKMFTNLHRQYTMEDTPHISRHRKVTLREHQLAHQLRNQMKPGALSPAPGVRGDLGLLWPVEHSRWRPV